MGFEPFIEFRWIMVFNILKKHIVIPVTSISRSPLTAWWMQVHVLSLLNLLICPYLGCVTEAGKWRIGGQGLTVVSGWRVSGDWVSLQSWSWSSGLGSGPGSHPGSSRLSRRFGWNFHWRKPRASRGEPGPSRAEPLPAASECRTGSGSAQDKKVIVLSS